MRAHDAGKPQHIDHAATSGHTPEEPIAIIGLGCRLPGGVNTPAAFWQLLHDGVDAVTAIPTTRWDTQAYYDPDPTAPGKHYIQAGAFLTELDLLLDWQRNPDTLIYNVFLVARLHEHVQVDILRQAAQFLLDRHPALRTVYLFTAEGPQQQVQIRQAVDFALVDGTTWTEAEVQAWIDAEADRPFDLATGPLMRMRLLQRACHAKVDSAEKRPASQVCNQQDGQPHYLLHWAFLNFHVQT